jgi:hypothetical protein
MHHHHVTRCQYNHYESQNMCSPWLYWGYGKMSRGWWGWRLERLSTLFIVNSLRSSPAHMIQPKVLVTTSFFVVKGPQQMLRTHRSLKSYCATLWWRFFFFLPFFQVMEHRWNEIDRVKPKYSGGTCRSATLSTTNPTWTDLGSNPGLRGERPATNRLSHGTALPDVTWLSLPAATWTVCRLWMKVGSFHAATFHRLSNMAVRFQGLGSVLQRTVDIW